MKSILYPLIIGLLAFGAYKLFFDSEAEPSSLNSVAVEEDSAVYQYQERIRRAKIDLSKYKRIKKIFKTIHTTDSKGRKGVIVLSGPEEWVEYESVTDGEEDFMSLLFAGISERKPTDTIPNENHVNGVFYIPEGHVIPYPFAALPSVEKVIYHNLAVDEDFGGILVDMPVFEGDSKKGSRTYELRLPDDDINVLIDFLSGDLKLENNTYPKLKVWETDSPALLPEKVR